MSNPNKKYMDPIWGGLKKLRLPSLIVNKATESLILDDYGLSVLTALIRRRTERSSTT